LTSPAARFILATGTLFGVGVGVLLLPRDVDVDVFLFGAAFRFAAAVFLEEE
jgi:hypothetical protein